MVVVTQHTDNFRSGFNPDEKILTTANVQPSTFGKIHEFVVDGSVYAQPLVARNVRLEQNSQEVDILYVATMHNTVYAFDVLNPGFRQVWSKTLEPSIQLPNTKIGPGEGGMDNTGLKPKYKDIAWEVGILSTPVIDTNSGLLFVLSTSQDPENNISHTLWKLRLNGDILGERPISASFGKKTFRSSQQLQRSALTLKNDTVYVTFAGYGDRSPWQGWIIGYKTTKILHDYSSYAPDYVFCTQPNENAEGGGIWQAGQGPAVDDAGNLYVVTGNGYCPLYTEQKNNTDHRGTCPERKEFGSSILKLSPTLEVLTYFAPKEAFEMSNADDDLGSGGLLLIPNTNLVVGGGKTHKLYLMDRNSLGGYCAKDNVLQTMDVAQATDRQGVLHHIHGSPAYYQGSNGIKLFVWPENMELKQVSLTLPGGPRSMAITGKSCVQGDPDDFPGGTKGMPGGFITVSCNGNPATPGTGILWANHPYQGDANNAIRSGVLRAFDAECVGKQLWSSRQNYVRDDLGNFAKFCCPTVANGFVYQASMGGLQQKTAFKFGQGPHGKSQGTPALAVRRDGTLIIAWTSDCRGMIRTSPNGLTWNTMPSLIGDIKSQFQPSLAHDSSNSNTFIAWTNFDGLISIMQSSSQDLKTWRDHVKMKECSKFGPTLAFGSSKLFVGWSDGNGYINVASTIDGGKTWCNKVKLNESTDSRPTMAFNGAVATLVLAWPARGNCQLSFLELRDLESLTGGSKTAVTNHFTQCAIAVAYDYLSSSVVTAFTRIDNRNLQAAFSKNIAELREPSARWRWFYDDCQSALGGPSLVVCGGNVVAAWSDTTGVVNVAILKRGSVSMYGLLR